MHTVKKFMIYCEELLKSNRLIDAEEYETGLYITVNNDRKKFNFQTEKYTFRGECDIKGIYNGNEKIYFLKRKHNMTAKEIQYLILKGYEGYAGINDTIYVRDTSN